MLLTGLPEVESVDRECDGHREAFRTAEDRPDEELPVLQALPADDPKPEDGPEESQDMTNAERVANRRRLVLTQEGSHALVVRLRGVDRLQDSLVSLS